MTQIEAVRSRAMQSLRPPPKTDLATWLESNVHLPDTVSATPGKIRLWPYQRGIADAISDPNIERVTLVKSVRIGLSTLITGTVASYVANEPSPILLLLPRETDCRGYAVDDLEPIFEATPILRGLLDDETEGGRNTILSRRFPGGSLKIVAAQSPRNLRRHNVRVLLIDEADAMEVTPEGDPIALAEKRTLSFPGRKIILGSTPIIEDTSNVLRAYRKSNKQVFEVSCPHCGERFEILWANIKWPEGKPEKAYCVCPHNGCVIEESEKRVMSESGDWRATAPHVSGHAGFKINALVSTLPNASWGNLASEFVEAKKDAETLQTFVNTILAEGWKEAGEELDQTELAGRSEAFALDEMPTEIRLLTAGVDVQHDRLECTVLGWTADDDIFIMAHEVFYGDVVNSDAPWQELDGYLNTRWAHPLGGTIGIAATAVDSGDGQTMDTVHAFTGPRFNRRIMSIKGDSGNRPVIQASKSQATKLWIVGVDTVKAHLFKRLEGRSIRFSETLPAVWYEQFASEKRVVRYSKGRAVAEWHRIKGRRAEALDCTVYAYAVRQIVQARMTDLENNLRAVLPQRTIPASIPSPWMAR